MIMASDASSVHGYWTSVCACAPGVAHDIGRLAERRDDYVRQRREPGDEPERLRIGQSHAFGLRKADFTDVLSIKVPKVEHPSV